MCDFNSSSPPSNSLADDMWRAFLNETGADCTITCESFSDAEQTIEDDVVIYLVSRIF